MATSWMLVDEDGQRRPIALRAKTRAGVQAAVRREKAAGRNVVAAYQGGPWAIALSPQVYPSK